MADNFPYGSDPEAVLRMPREQIEGAVEMQRRIAALAGQATSDDERVRVTFTQADGLADLHLDPRALRMPSTELATLIKQVAQDARRDLERQIREVVEGSTGRLGMNPAELNDMFSDPQRVTQTISEMSQIFSGAIKNSTEMLEEIRRKMGLDRG